MNIMQDIRSGDGFDPFDLDAPHAVWKLFREEKPIFFHEDSGYWIVSRYSDMRAIFDDWECFSSENAQAPMRPMCEEGLRIMADGDFTAYSGLTARVPPDHSRIRKAAQTCFSPRRFKAIEPQIEDIVARHLDAMRAAKTPGQPIDFWQQVAYPVPAHVLFTLMGIPESDVDAIKQFGKSRAAMTYGDLSDAEQIPVAHDMVAYWKYCRELVAKRRAVPGDDFPSDLLKAQKNGVDISDHEISSVMYSVLFAGHETTSTLMGNAILVLMENRDAWEAICADETLIPGAVDELLRYAPSVVGWRRKARYATTVGGVALPEGAQILMITGSGNRDDAQFPDGERFDISRSNARTHLSFGYGIHHCIGYQLARMEVSILLRQLTRRFGSLRLPEGFYPGFLRNITFRVPKQVLVEWDEV